MWSSREFRIALLVAAASLTSASCAKPSDAVCPKRSADTLQQIYLFDGAPEEQAYLAPSNGKSDVYELREIFAKGRFVTVRCEYTSGTSTDVKLDARLRRCVFRSDKAEYGNLHCQ